MSHATGGPGVRKSDPPTAEVGDIVSACNVLANALRISGDSSGDTSNEPRVSTSNNESGKYDAQARVNAQNSGSHKR